MKDTAITIYNRNSLLCFIKCARAHFIGKLYSEEELAIRCSRAGSGSHLIGETGNLEPASSVCPANQIIHNFGRRSNPHLSMTSTISRILSMMRRSDLTSALLTQH